MEEKDKYILDLENKIIKFSQAYGYMLGVMEDFYEDAPNKNYMRNIINKFDKIVWDQIHNPNISEIDLS